MPLAFRRTFSPLVAIIVLSFVSVLAFAEPGRSDRTQGGGERSDEDIISLVELIRQSQRTPGQTEFVDVQSYGGGFPKGLRGAVPEAALASAQSAPAGTDKREVQEHDVFAIDPDTGMLFLLTRDRGLVILDAENNTVGRLKASGNNPEMMYYDKKKKRLVVIEQDWTGAFRRGANKNQIPNSQDLDTVVSSIDVSNPEVPVRKETLGVPGNVADTRMVGSILYVTSSIYEEEGGYGFGFRSRSSKSRGRVTSIELKGKKLTQVQSVDSALPSGESNMIRIVERPVGNGKFRYYAIAISPQESKDGFWMWRRASRVEVFDITDPKGDVHKILEVPVTGNVQKATQANILDDGHLVVVSNYLPGADEEQTSGRSRRNDSKWRVSAQVFPLPEGAVKDTAISAIQATARSAQIAAKVESIANSVDRTIEAEKLATQDGTLLAGIPVKTAEGHYTYLFPKSSEDRGDTEGQHATVRDVRYTSTQVGETTTNYASVVWVPENRVDPWDVYQIIDGQITFLNRLRFEGWMERMIPYQYDGRTLFVGFGWITPSDDRQGRRVPQVKIFEQLGTGDNMELHVRSELTLKDIGIWSDMQGEDKLWTPNFDPSTGKGTVLFPVSGYNSATGGSFSGAKVVAFDFTKVERTGSKSKAISDGGLLVGSTGWIDQIKRVMEDGRRSPAQVLTFSDSMLSDFGTYERTLASPGELIEAQARFELARNIEGYVAAGKNYGIQIVTKGADSSDASAAAVELRVVNANQFDAMKPLTTESLAGRYLGHKVLADEGILLVFTSVPIFGAQTEWGYRPVTGYTYHLYSVHLPHSWVSGDKVAHAFTSKTLEVVRDNQNPLYMDTEQFGQDLVEVASGKYLWAGELYSAGLLQITVSETDVKFDVTKVEGLDRKDIGQNQLSLLNLGGGRIGVTFSTPVRVDDARVQSAGLYVQRRHLITATEKKGVWNFDKQSLLNVPGGQNIAYVSEAGILVVQGTQTTDLMVAEVQSTLVDDVALLGVATAQSAIEREKAFSVSTIQSPVFLAVDIGSRTQKKKATLVDVQAVGKMSTYGWKQVPSNTRMLVNVHNETPESSYGWGGGIQPMFMMPNIGWRRRQQPPQMALDFIEVDSSGKLVCTSRLIDGESIGQYPTILGVAQRGVGGENLLVLRDGNKAQVVSFQGSQDRPIVQPLHTYDERMQRSENPSQFVPLEGSMYGYWWGSGLREPFSYDGNRGIYIPNNMAGVCRFDLAEEGRKAVEERKTASSSPTRRRSTQKPT